MVINIILFVFFLSPAVWYCFPNFFITVTLFFFLLRKGRVFCCCNSCDILCVSKWQSTLVILISYGKTLITFSFNTLPCYPFFLLLSGNQFSQVFWQSRKCSILSLTKATEVDTLTLNKESGKPLPVYKKNIGEHQTEFGTSVFNWIIIVFYSTIIYVYIYVWFYGTYMFHLRDWLS